MRNLYVECQNPTPYSLKVHVGLRSRSLGQISWSNTCFGECMYGIWKPYHLYMNNYMLLELFNQNFAIKSRSLGKMSWYQNVAPFMVNVCMKYESPITYTWRDTCIRFKNFVTNTVYNYKVRVQSLGLMYWYQNVVLAMVNVCMKNESSITYMWLPMGFFLDLDSDHFWVNKKL